MPVGFTKLSRFPRHRLIDADLLRCRAHELDLLAAFGEPTLETAASEPEPLFYWDLEWDCGLVMSLQLHQLSEQLVVRLSEPDLAHARRHLGDAVREVRTLEQDDPEAFRRLGTPLNRAWEVWKDDGGNGRVTLERGLTERDAACRLVDREAEQEGRFGIAEGAPPPPVPGQPQPHQEQLTKRPAAPKR